MAGSNGIQQKTWNLNEIKANLVYLTENMTNLHKILTHLRQDDIISDDESQLIDSEKTDARKINRLLYLIQKKDWFNRRPMFLKILNLSGNRHCAEKIEQTPFDRYKATRNNILPSKWWPEKKTLPLAFQKRKSDNRLHTVQIKEILSRDESNKMTVITQKVAVSGFGGIGKTTTAIWFATQYENDYCHVIWIDCGEKSLLNSFKNLARDLDVKHLQELEMKQLALGCFQILQDWNCLFIFDNAECYTGPEGVKEVLPKFNTNFDVLITSRNKKWGDGTGDGEISQFIMNLFDQQEGVEFIKNNIKGLSSNEEFRIKLLCDLLGNLPLALQIAVATVNEEKIHMEEYIYRIKNTPEILHRKFDNYEKTIYKTLQISMDLIKAHAIDDERKIGEVACKILTIFGYITPDDVPLEFFMAVDKCINMFDLHAAIKLLESFSLLSKKEKACNISRSEKSTMLRGSISDYQNTVSIHRLLQQVIRHSTEPSRQNILKNILSCKGFLDYKLIPFSLANEKLKNKFPKIKAELIDKLKIFEFLRERRFTEAVELSRIISSTLKNSVSTFDYGVCLKQNSELNESKVVLNSVLRMISNPFNQWGLFKSLLGWCSAATVDSDDYCFTQWGTIADVSTLNKEVVLGQLFSIYLLENNIEKAKNIVLSVKKLILPIVPLNGILTCLSLAPLSIMFLKIYKQKQYITLELQGEKNERQLQHYSWVMDEHIIIPDELHLALQNTSYAYSSIRVDQLKGRGVHMYEWGKAKWIVNKLFLQNVQFTQASEMMITILEITHSSVDITILPILLKKLKLNECFLINSSKHFNVNRMPGLLQELSLINIFVERKHGNQCTPFDISHFITPTLSKLKVRDFDCKCPCLQLSMKVLTSIKSLHLEKCCLKIIPQLRLGPSELTLNIVRIVDSNNIPTTAMVNHFVDMKQLQSLWLTGMTVDCSVAVDIRDLTLINVELLNWDIGCWRVQKLNIYPNPGYTQMEIDERQNLPEPGNVGTIASNDVKKEKLLTILKSISSSKTISGLYLWDAKIGAIEKIKRFVGVFPCILTTWMPKYSAGIGKWHSFVENTISYWNNHYLMHIRYASHGHPLEELLKDGNETSWIDLIEESGERNKLWKKSLDTLAPFLLQLQTAGVVPILDLLPYINHNSNFYLWGGRGGFRGSWKLFQITKDYLTLHHGLTSALWNWSLWVRGDMARLENYWPGNNYVDVASVDMDYTKEMNNTDYQNLLDVVGDKPIAMEGMYFIPSTKLLDTQSRWTWFTVDDVYLTDEQYNSEQNTKTTFNSASVINRGTNPFFNLTFRT